MGQGLDIVSNSESEAIQTYITPPRFRQTKEPTKFKISILDQLPSEVITDMLFSFIGVKYLFGICRLVCKRWNEFIITKNGIFIGGIDLRGKKSRKSFIKSCKRGSFAMIGGIGGFIGDITMKYLVHCSYLKKLVVWDRSLCWESIEIIPQLSSLTILEMNCVKLGVVGAEMISRITTLTRLHLVSNEIHDDGCKFICQNLTQLKYLALNRNNISDEGIRDISNLSHLNILSLNENLIGNCGMESITQVFNLKELNVCINFISSEGLVNISNLNQLETLRISFNSINDSGIVHLCELQSLSCLDLTFNNIGIEGAKQISKIESIREVKLVGNNIGEEELQYFSPSLK